MENAYSIFMRNLQKYIGYYLILTGTKMKLKKDTHQLKHMTSKNEEK